MAYLSKIKIQDGAGTDLTSTLVAGKQSLDVNLTQSVTLNASAAQSGTWTITGISGTISLPTGAATAANQTSIIGTKAAGTAATSSMLIGGIYNTTPITMTNGQQASLQLDVDGSLRVNVIDPIAAGTNIIGKMGIDQTTPGTTNGVQINAALPAGANSIGSVSISNFPVTQPISATTLPLPSGAATSALQTTISGQLPSALGAKITANSMAVNIASDQSTIPVSAYNPGTIDIFGNLIIGERNNQIVVDFSTGAVASKLISTSIGTASSSISSGKAIFSTGTGTTSSFSASTSSVVSYDPGHEIYVEFTASFTTPTSANSYQKIGWYDSNNGLYIGFIGTFFGVTRRSGAADTTVTKASFSEDTLVGATTSKYTRVGVPEAIDLTKINVFRIRLGWLGAAPIVFEVLSPDGVWVIFHKILYPNSANIPSLQSTAIPISIEVNKSSSDATDLIISTLCWSAGTTKPADNPILGASYSGFAPDPSVYSTGATSAIKLDVTGALIARSTVLTDEDSYRDDFTGNSLVTTLSGITTFLNGSLEVTGSGTNFLSSVKMGDYIKLSSDSENFFAIVSSVNSNLLIILSSGYGGSSSSGTSVISNFKSITGAGSTLAVASSLLTITTPTTTGISSGIIRHGDYGPMKWVSNINIASRLSSQTIHAGMANNLVSPNSQVFFEFSGTGNTAVTCISGATSASLQTTQVILPLNLTTATNHKYEMNISDDSVEFLIDGIVVAQHQDHIPYTYQVMEYGIYVSNTGTVASTNTISCDLIYFKNFDQIEVGTANSGKPLKVESTSSAAQYGTITNTQSVASFIKGTSSFGFEVTGAWTGSLTFEGLIGSTWSSVDVFNISTELVSTTSTVNGTFIFANIAGLTQVRVRGNTVLTGSAAIVIAGNNSSFTYPLFSREQGATIGSYGVQLGGVDATNNTFQFQRVNTLGAAAVYLEGSNKAAYCCTIVPVTPPATPSDIITIYGSATKTVRILKIVLNTTQTTIGINDWYIIKRSSANTGGTSAAIVSVPVDSNFPAATAVVSRYTVNPTALGTTAGNLAIVNIVSPPSTPGTSGTGYIPYVFDFTNNPIVLRGVAQGVSVNFNGAVLPGGLSVNFNVTFTEE